MHSCNLTLAEATSSTLGEAQTHTHHAPGQNNESPKSKSTLNMAFQRHLHSSGGWLHICKFLGLAIVSSDAQTSVLQVTSDCYNKSQPLSSLGESFQARKDEYTGHSALHSCFPSLGGNPACLPDASSSLRSYVNQATAKACCIF